MSLPLFASRMGCRSSLRHLSNGVRHYSTPSEPAKKFPSGPLWAFAAASTAAGAFYLWNASGRNPALVKSEVKGTIWPSGNKAFKGGDQGFIDLKLEDVEQVNHNTRRFRFALPEKTDISGLSTASCLVTKYQAPGEEKPVIRPYTPVSDENAVGYIDFLIKRYEGGPMSTHLHSMEPDQRLSMKGPIPKYPLSENQHKHIGLIAGGTGITPMWQLIHHVFANPNDQTQITLVFANQTEDDILLKKELQELENRYPRRFRAFYALDKPAPSWGGHSGFIDKTILKTVLPEPKEENIKLFICGPPPMYKAVSGAKAGMKQGELSGILKELGYSEDQVFKF